MLPVKSIIIFQEKYGDRYFDASTSESTNAACLVILKERFNSHWYDYSRQEPSDKNILSEEQIAQLPTENLKTQELSKRKDYLRELRYYQNEINFYERAKITVETNNPKTAYQLLLERNDGEYEGFEIENLEEAN